MNTLRHPPGCWQDNKIVTGIHACGQPSYGAHERSAGPVRIVALSAMLADDSLELASVPAQRSAAGRPVYERAGEQFLVMDRNLGAIGTDLKTRYRLVYMGAQRSLYVERGLQRRRT